MLRLIHTADWHLGHTLHGFDRQQEHDHFLQWLLATLVQQQVDVLLLAGDVFDTANPATSALARFYQFIAQVSQQAPQLQLLIVAGNHDSAARLEAPGSLLAALGTRVVGAMPPEEQWQDKLLIPLNNRHGEVEAWCGVVPFLRPADLPGGTEEEATSCGVSTLYGQVIARLRQLARSDQGVVVTGHCYLAGGAISEMSERRIVLGNQQALPVALFGTDVDYVALGHLHLAQQVGGQSHIRYSGSPIPLSLAERHYRHQVVQVDMVAGKVVNITPLPVPRTVAMLRLPERGALPLGDLLPRLQDLPSGPVLSSSPFLEVVVTADRADGVLRQRVEEALTGKAVRLAKLTLQRPGVEEDAAPPSLQPALAELSPDEVFQQRYRQQYHQDPPPPWLDAFHELVDLAGQEEGG